MRSFSLTIRVPVEAVCREVDAQALREIRDRGKWEELSGRECARLANQAIRVRELLGGKRDGA